MKRMELSHYEYQHEEWQYLQQKEREEDEKLQTVAGMSRLNSLCKHSTIDTIRKNLRTTTGKHTIKIDEHIISNLQNNNSH